MKLGKLKNKKCRRPIIKFWNNIWSIEAIWKFSFSSKIYWYDCSVCLYLFIYFFGMARKIISIIIVTTTMKMHFFTSSAQALLVLISCFEAPLTSIKPLLFIGVFVDHHAHVWTALRREFIIPLLQFVHIETLEMFCLCFLFAIQFWIS